MKILVEDSLPYGREFFSSLGRCELFSHKTITPELAADADILLVRSTTKVNQALLARNTKIQYVATATAGIDHLDQGYLDERGIAWNSAAGCNALAVAEYVVSAIYRVAQSHNWHLQDKSVGIVGAGHVGSALAPKLEAMGLTVFLCDPPLADAGDPRHFVDMEAIMACDIISLHVPLVTSAPYPTEHLFDAKRLAQLSEQQLLINACRGEVIDNQALLNQFEQGWKGKVVLDVWENEPGIELALLPYVIFGTAHIAGHTIEGKARGTEMLYQQVCQRLGKNAELSMYDFLPPVEVDVSELIASWAGVPTQAQMAELVFAIYDIAADSEHFMRENTDADAFRYIRKHYNIRREFSSIFLNAGNSPQLQALYGLGFARG